MLKQLKSIVKLLEEIKKMLSGNELMNSLEKQYVEYKFFADDRGRKILADAGLLDEYNIFMSQCEEIIFADEKVLLSEFKIELPKPSKALEAFKNKFNKFF